MGTETGGTQQARDAEGRGGATLEGAHAGTREPGSGVVVRDWTERALDVFLSFHIVFFSSNQVYVWVGLNHDTAQGSIHAAMPTKFDVMPLSTTLLGATADSAGASMAARIAKRAGCGIILAANLPSGSSMLESFAEKKIVKALSELREEAQAGQ